MLLVLGTHFSVHGLNQLLDRPRRGVTLDQGLQCHVSSIILSLVLCRMSLDGLVRFFLHGNRAAEEITSLLRGVPWSGYARLLAVKVQVAFAHAF